ncbi:hypothetical protein [Tenacibaculum sp. 190524A05c]|uniref:hypothetical protein n=1 Tax=Tenacibaculum platacis TaxID=3137852 RepID=UPI0031FB4B72
MIRNIKNLGSVLNRKDQKKITGGCGSIYERCEPWDDEGGSPITICRYQYGTNTYHYITHYSCDSNVCYGGELVSSTC